MAKKGDLWSISHEKIFSEVDDGWETYPSAPSSCVHYFVCIQSMKQYMCMLKIVMGYRGNIFKFSFFCVAVACSFPFLPLLCHYVLQLVSVLLELTARAQPSTYVIS